MSTLQMIGIDLAAMLVLVLGLYFPRHRRSDLVAAFLGVNVGVLAVATVLANSTVSAGLGLGLFGVLSIIRLRSDQISQTEIAYYFAALSIGLLSGMSTQATPLLIGLIALILGALALGDSALVFGRYTTRTVQLDSAIADQDALVAALEERLGASVVATRVIKLDLVNDLTLVDVRTKQSRGKSATASPRRGARPHAGADPQSPARPRAEDQPRKKEEKQCPPPAPASCPAPSRPSASGTSIGAPPCSPASTASTSWGSRRPAGSWPWWTRPRAC